MDWLAFAFACAVVSFQVVGELKDIALCTISLEHLPASTVISPAWKYGLAVIGLVRRWVFLTLLVISVPLLVVYKGGDALSVCFNTIAILFMTEIDNVCYHFGLGEKTKARMEAAGRVVLTDQENENLLRLKVVHIFLVVISCLVTVMLAGSSVDHRLVPGVELLGSPAALFFISLFFMFWVFWIGGILEAVGQGWGKKQLLKHIGLVTVARIASVCIMSIMLRAAAL
eukprot:SAG31_NODE_8509_length_1439_cov_1.197015_2_plen_228_part_00